MLLLPLLASLAAATAKAPAARPLSHPVSFAKSLAPVRIRWGGAELRLRPVSDHEGLIRVATTIRIPGRKPIALTDEQETSRGSPRIIAIGRLSRSDPAPSVVIQTYTGGAHCCATLTAIVPDGAGLRVIAFPNIDNAPVNRFPTDLDGDGRVDFLRQDDAFDYTFSSHAGSFSPPVVYNLVGGRRVDVSRRPGFRRIWLKFAALTRRRCASGDSDRNGACAAYVAAGARLGRYQASLREAEGWAQGRDEWTLPEACRDGAGQGGCHAGDRIRFPNFPAMIDWFLRRHGYLG